MILEWIVYGTLVLSPFTNTDNPPLNHCGLVGEVAKLPYTVPAGYNLVIEAMQVEGPAPDSNSLSQFGMNLWIGEYPATNDKGVASCTTGGGSAQLNGMRFVIPAGKKVNLRMMNNTNYPWANGFYVQGHLEKI
jgi:hypothetical protein